MRLVIFGAGKMYQEYKKDIKKDIEIVGFIDNEMSKWGKHLDGIMIYPPSDLITLEYDAVFLLSIYYRDMRLQLRKMGIPRNKIFTIDNHIELLVKDKPMHCYGILHQESSGKRVLIFSHALSSTGAQNVLYQVCDVLRKNDFQVTVVSKSDGILRERFIEIGIPVIIIRDIYSKKKNIDELVAWSDMIFVNTLLLYDTVYELSNYNKKLIWWIHESGELDYIQEDFELIEKKENVSIYSVSPLVRRMIWKKYSEKLKIESLLYGIPQYDTQVVKTIRQEKMIFALIGWIGYIKGQDIFLSAVNQLSATIREQAEFWIVGGGKLSSRELNIVKKHSCIKVLGEIEHTLMYKLYNQIDVVVSCSREDAMPVVVTEGCMTGKLIILSDAIGSADFIEHGKTGLVFKNEDVDGLIRWIEWAVSNREQAERIGRASKEVYKKYFSMDQFKDNLLAIIK